MTNYATALERAIDRDIDDGERLAWIADRVLCWLDELAPELYAPLQHPRRRWSPADLAEALREQLCNIREEQENLKGAVFVDESWP